MKSTYITRAGSKLLAAVLAAAMTAAVVCTSCTEDGDETYYKVLQDAGGGNGNGGDGGNAVQKQTPVSPIVAGEAIEPIDLSAAGTVIRGIDMGSVIAEEASGVKYYDKDGNERDIFGILKDRGVNCIRVRVWNDPYDEEGRPYGAGVCDVNVAVQIAKRCAAVGLPLLVDFHYSDFWCDPGRAHRPKEWVGMTADQIAPKLKYFTYDTLCQIQATGAKVYMVQVGNEINKHFCGFDTGGTISYDEIKLLRAGSTGVRQAAPDALVAVHFANAILNRKSPDLNYYVKKFVEPLRDGVKDANGKNAITLDYDVFGTSWYPAYSTHGSPDQLRQVLANVVAASGKKVLIAETSHSYTADDGDNHGNTISSTRHVNDDVWDVSVEGQAQFITDLLNFCSSFDANEDGVGGDCLGMFWWEGAWVPVPGNNRAERNVLWEKYGSGWATKFAADYDEDVSIWDGGSAVDNQALFDFSGKELDSLAAFGTTNLTPPVQPRPTAKVAVVTNKSVAFTSGKLAAIADAAAFTTAKSTANIASNDKIKAIVVTVGTASDSTQTTWLTATSDASSWNPMYEFNTEVHGGSIANNTANNAIFTALLSSGMWLANSNSGNKVSETRNVTVKLEYYTD